MKPSDTANYLRKIAAAIESSKKPNASLVAKDINLLVRKLTAGSAEDEVQKLKRSLDGSHRAIMLQSVQSEDEDLKNILQGIEQLQEMLKKFGSGKTD